MYVQLPAPEPSEVSRLYLLALAGTCILDFFGGACFWACLCCCALARCGKSEGVGKRAPINVDEIPLGFGTSMTMIHSWTRLTYNSVNSLTLQSIIDHSSIFLCVTATSFRTTRCTASGWRWSMTRTLRIRARRGTCSSPSPLLDPATSSRWPVVWWPSFVCVVGVHVFFVVLLYYLY